MESTTIPTTKRCPKCGRILPISEFGKDSRAADKHLCYCKKCSTENQKQRRLERNKTVFSLLTDKFTLKDYIDAVELADIPELATTFEGAKRALSQFCRTGIISKIDDMYYRKIWKSSSLPGVVAVKSESRPEKPVVVQTLSSYPPIELMAELYKKGYRWKEMTITITQTVPIQNVQDYINAHA